MNDTRRTIRPETPFSFGSIKISDDFDNAQISLKSVSVSGEVQGLLFTSVICQEYHNESDDNLEIIYTFPVAWDTTLLGLSAKIGNKQLTGHVVEKSEAEAQYEKAVLKGDSAIMVERSAKGLYTANLGNIRAGESVTVEIRCARLLRFEGDCIRLCIPTVIGARYGDAYGSGGLAPHEAVNVDTRVQYNFSLCIAITGEMAKGSISSPSHAVAISAIEDKLCVKLQEGATLDRDFILLLHGVAGHSFAHYVSGINEHLVLASFAPNLPQQTVTPLGLKILVDCSGSMGGESILQAQQGLQQIIDELLPQDYVSYSCFGSHVEHRQQELLPCIPSTIKRLTEHVATTRADMGGTNMEQALASTFADIAQPQNVDVPPVVLLITDGDVWGVEEIITTAKASGHRIFAIGVGSAPQESLLQELAEQTGGACSFVTPGESMQKAVVQMFHRMRRAIALDIHVQWGEEPLWQSTLPKHLYNGETVHCFAFMQQQPTTPPVLFWNVANEIHSISADQVEVTDNNEDLFRLGKSRQMEECSSAEEKLNIALTYQLVSEYSSLILTYERDPLDKAQGLPKIQQVPHMPAHGHGCNTVYASLSRHAGQPLGCCPDSVCWAPLDTCSMVPPVGGMEDGAIVMESDEDEQDNTALSYDALMEHIIQVWKERVYTTTTVMECLEPVLVAPYFSVLHTMLAEMQQDMGLSMEQVYAVFMQWVFATIKSDEQLDRHSLRLIRMALMNISSSDTAALTQRFTMWYSQA